MALIASPISERVGVRPPSFDDRIRLAAIRARYPGVERLSPSAPFDVVFATVAAARRGLPHAPPPQHTRGFLPRPPLPSFPSGRGATNINEPRRRLLYGHPDAAMARERIRAAFRTDATVVALPSSHESRHDRARRTA